MHNILGLWISCHLLACCVADLLSRLRYLCLQATGSTQFLCAPFLRIKPLTRIHRWWCPAAMLLLTNHYRNWAGQGHASNVHTAQGNPTWKMLGKYFYETFNSCLLQQIACLWCQFCHFGSAWNCCESVSSSLPLWLPINPGEERLSYHERIIGFLLNIF